MSRDIATDWVDEHNKPVYSGPADKAHETLEPGIYDVPGGVVVVGEQRSVYVAATTAKVALAGAAVASAALIANLIRRHA